VSPEAVEVSIDAASAGLAPGLLEGLVAKAGIDAADGKVELRLGPYDVRWLKGIAA
jgi:hypothetical protein